MNTTETMDDGASINGVLAAADAGNDPAKAQEYADVKKWFKAITAARKFDEVARVGYFLDRKYLKGDSGAFDVEVPIAQTYVEVLNSFLYARNPSVNVGASQLTEPPPQKQMLDMAIDEIRQQRQQQADQMQAAAKMAQQMTAGLPPAAVAQLAQLGKNTLIEAGAGQPGGPAMPPEPDPSGQPQPPPQVGDIADNDPDVTARVSQMMQPYQRQRDNAKQFGDTMEIIIEQLWREADLKHAYTEKVMSALSVGVGWTKSFYMERHGVDPTTQKKIDDIVSRLASIAETRQELASGDADDEDAEKAELEQQLAALRAMPPGLLQRGFVTDYVPPEDIQVSTDVPLIRYRNASWIAHRDFLSKEDAETEYPSIKEQLSAATLYYAKKPEDSSRDDTGNVSRQTNTLEVSASQADAYQKSNEGPAGTLPDAAPNVCRWEIWDRCTGNVITLIEGVKCYAKAPFVPDIRTTRFFPFFLYGIGFINGQRHPRSLINRSAKLFDEYNAVRTNYREARRRAIPKTAYKRNLLEAEEAQRLAQATTGEMVGITLLQPDADIRTALMPVAYAQIDPALYDTSAVRADLEMVWGVQEALSSAIRTPKTATEAQIQQQGTSSRLSAMADTLDDDLDDLSVYTAETALQVLDQQDAEEMAGPFALWPEGMNIDDMHAMLSIDIDAGSSGKPKTAAQQQAWSQMLPLFMGQVEKIGALRGSSKEEVADCLESLLEQTAKLTGEGFDAQQFMPDPPRTPPPPPAGPAEPVPNTALMGPQTAALEDVITRVNAGALSPEQAQALIAIAFPAAPPEQVQTLINSPRPVPPAALPGAAPAAPVPTATGA